MCQVATWAIYTRLSSDPTGEQTATVSPASEMGPP